MIKLSQIHVPIKHSEADLRNAAAKLLRVSVSDIRELKILKQSIDARKKQEIGYSYAAAVSVNQEERLLRKGFESYKPKRYHYAVTGTKPLKNRPVIIGAGPCGLFAAYMLAKEGYRPIVLERGPSMDGRVEAVEAFYETGRLNPEANVLFGEGGAGTFSDGKLNSLINDKDGKGQFVLDTFAAFGAPEEITYKNKPHIGTDLLRKVIVNMRKETERLGGTFCFETKVVAIETKDGQVSGVRVQGASDEFIPCEVCILAIGHSARDTFKALYESGICMEPKAFAVGVRIQHTREWVNRCQYKDAAPLLPAADYKLTHSCRDGRGVYSFCMCPGGYVVNASSEPGMLTVNGMSNHSRDAENSNAAIVVTVTPSDYENPKEPGNPLSGIAFQRDLERKAYEAGQGKIPTQRYEDFKEDRPSIGCGTVSPCTKGAVSYTNLRPVLPEWIGADIIEGIEAFDSMMPGFANGDALLSAVESRTSSPVRILRGDNLQSVSFAGLYPCGEGAGYAGGITSAAMDGIRVFEEIIKEFTYGLEA